MNDLAFCTSEILWGSLEQLREYLLIKKRISTVLLLSRSAMQRWKMQDFVQKLQEGSSAEGVPFILIDQVPMNPRPEDLSEILKKIGDTPVNRIIAFGGGSSIDLAKGIKALYDPSLNESIEPEEVAEKIRKKEYVPSEDIHITAVPSTAGTGSELTQWATFWDLRERKKYSIDHEDLKPDTAYIVPELTLSMSLKMTLSTGLDALCQAIEAYWSVRTSPLIQELSYRAIELNLQNLPNVLRYPNDIMFREKMCRASILTAMAFSKTRTTACHSISYPLTMRYGILHGMAVAMTVDAISKINRGNFPASEELFELFQCYGGLNFFLERVSEGILPLRLSKYGVLREELEEVAKESLTKGRMDNNPVILTEEEVYEVLKSIW